MKAFHFTGDHLRDGRPLPEVNQELRHEGPVEICISGLHASKRLIDALAYAPGSLLHVVECKEVCTEHNDKFVCQSRTILETYPITKKQCVQFAIEAACLAFWFVGGYSQDLIDALDACQMKDWLEVERLCWMAWRSTAVRAARAADSAGSAGRTAARTARGAGAAARAAAAATARAAACAAASATAGGRATAAAEAAAAWSGAADTLEARAQAIFLQLSDLESAMS